MSITYPAFYQFMGIRRGETMASPRLHPYAKFQLPRGAILHYLPKSPKELGISIDDPMLKSYTRVIMVENILKLAVKKGNPRPSGQIGDTLGRRYFQSNRRARPVRRFEVTDKDVNTLIIENYAILQHLFRYQRTFYTQYYEWFNLHMTLVQNINAVADRSERQHFLVLGLPTTIPTIELLKQAETTIATEDSDDQLTQLEEFYKGFGVSDETDVNIDELQGILDEEHSDELSTEELTLSTEEVPRRIITRVGLGEAMLFAHIWTWLGKNRQNSLLSLLSDNAIRHLNLVLVESGRFIVVNMGRLDDWRRDPEMQSEDNTGMMTNTIQRLFYRAALTLMSARSENAGEQELDRVEEESEHEPAVPQTGDGHVDLPLDESEANKGEQGEDGAIVAGTEQDDDLPLDDPEENEVIDSKFAEVHDDASDVLMESALADHEHHEVEAPDEVDRVSSLSADEDLAELNALVQERQQMAESKPLVVYTAKPKKIEDGVVDAANGFLEKGLITPGEAKRMHQLAERYKVIPDPFGKEETLEKALVIKKEHLEINNHNHIVGKVKGILDTSVESSSLVAYDSQYIENVLSKDVLASVMSVQKSGVAVQSYSVERVETLHDEYDLHLIKVVPTRGKPSTLPVQIPVIKPDGTFKVKGVRYFMRKQNGDAPITKESERRVALSSYASKLFVERAERKVNNYDHWLMTQINAITIDPEDKRIVDFKRYDVFEKEAVTPRSYSIIAKQFIELRTGEYDLYFSYARRHEKFGKEAVEAAEHDGLLVVGRNHRTNQLLVLDKQNIVYTVDKKDPNQTEPVGSMEDLLQLDKTKRPLEMVEVTIGGKPLPLGFLLAYRIGFSNLLSLLKVEPRIYPAGVRFETFDNEFAIKFADQTVVVNADDKMAEYLLSGFDRFYRDVKRYKLSHFDKKDVYQMVLDRNHFGARFLRATDNVFDAFIDPITEGYLKDMGEPTEMVGLFKRATELLLNDQHFDEGHMDARRIKGYERVAGAVYNEINKAVRTFQSRTVVANASVELHPQAVWLRIMDDPAVMVVNDSNPLHQLREQEVVISGGTGGRTGRTLTAKSRIYNKTSMGVISEATTDNSEVATTVYLTADPMFTNVRGKTRRWDKEKDGAAKLVSSAMMLTPGSDRDDPKRTNFVGIQNSSTTFAESYTPMPLRTDFVRMVAHRTGELYAITAKQPGKVIAVSDDHVEVEYKDGTKASYETGRKFGSWAGSTIPHDITANVTEGQEFDVGTVITYNTNYFVKDTLDPNQVILKFGTLARTLMIQTNGTFEDSTALSEAFAKKMTTRLTLPRYIRVDFEQQVIDLVKVGDTVDLESILCTLEDSTESTSSLFDEEIRETLKLLTNKNPRAKMSGKVDKIEVMYNGELEDMSPSLKRLANSSDRARSSLNEKLGKSKVSGQVNSSLRFDGTPLDKNSAVIVVYITGDFGMGIADKGVFANQLKCTVGEILTGIQETEDGEEIDAHFGQKSASNRIVESVMLIGTANRLLVACGKEAVDAYFGE